MARETMAKKMAKQRLLIFNSQDPEIFPYLNSMGIDNDHIENGKQLFNNVTELEQNQKKEYQAQDLAYDNYQGAKENCENFYKKTLKIVKMASRADSNLQDRIKIKIARERSIEAWIRQAVEFYNLLLNETSFLENIAKYGLTVEKLTTQKDDIATLQNIRNEAMSGKGQAQEATSLRDKKIEELDDYCYELKTIVTIALEEHPQLLEKLGIIVKR
jgi:hypothetical protein